MSILIFLIVSYILLSISLYLLFPKAGIDANKGLIPGVNFMEWCELIGRPKWWALLLLVPIVNLFIFAGMAVDMARSFGKFDFGSAALAVIYAPALFFKLSKDDTATYEGPVLTAEKEFNERLALAKKTNDKLTFNKLSQNNPYQKGGFREWIESIVFAVFAAAFIRMFLIEAFVIPTSSMEGSLNVGDFLFVSKVHYGVRTPSTVAMIPLLHNVIPGIGTESYLKKPNLPYYRLPALQDVQRNKPLVFNWPAGDSVYVTPSRSYSVDQVKREPGYLKADKALAQMVKRKDYKVRPFDKTDFYIKRCVGIPGDSISVRNRVIYINGEAQPQPKKVQFNHFFDYKKIGMNSLDRMGIENDDAIQDANTGQIGFAIDKDQIASLKSKGASPKVQGHAKQPIKLFPHDKKNFPNNSLDNFGPYWIPKAGTTTKLNDKNIALYKRIIRVYEDNDLQIKSDGIYINGHKTDQYTFKYDYYWAMGDNRHNSEDSRYWGYVPSTHVVGKPLVVWFSTKNGNIGNGINWDRIFMSADVD